MGKFLAVVLVVIALAVSGCDAFKGYYDPSGKAEAVVAAEAVPPEGETPPETPPVTPPAPAPVDYGTDTYVCDNLSAITVAVVDGDVDNGGWTTASGDYTTAALSLGAFTTKIEITNDEGKFSFVLKQTGDNLFNVCNVMFEGCVGECLGVKSIWSSVKTGTLNIAAFNKDVEGSVVNAGSFNVEFEESQMGDQGMTLEGSYKATAVETPSAE